MKLAPAIRLGRYLAALAVTSAVALPSALTAQDGPVSLQFGWAPGSADVSVTTQMTQQVMTQSQTTDTETQYRLTVTPSGDGFRISYSDFVVGGTALETLFGEAGAEDPQEFSQAMGAMQPDLLVGSGGAFVGLADYASMRSAMEEMMAPMRQELESAGMGPMFEEMISATLSEDTWTATAELGWNQMVGYWVDRTLQPGEPVTLASEMPMPMIANQRAPVEIKLTYVGTAPCQAGSTTNDCVEVSAEATPDPEEIRNMMDVFMADMMASAGAGDAQVGITAVDITTFTTLIMDPTTLRPYRMVAKNSSSVEMFMMGMSQATENTQTIVTDFAWAN